MNGYRFVAAFLRVVCDRRRATARFAERRAGTNVLMSHLLP
jgi:hypothetical protein